MKAFDIACWFVRRNEIEGELSEVDYMTNLKIQKLLYYAQGAFLAIKGEPLFEEKFVAWEHGPVVPSVYYNFKQFAGESITLSENYEMSESLEKEDESLLDDVYLQFGQFTAWKLRNMTHEEKPWLVTQRNHQIENELIKESFKDLYLNE